MVAVSLDRKSTRLNSSHGSISYAVFCLKKKKHKFNSLSTTYSYVSLASHDNTRHRAVCQTLFVFTHPATIETYPLTSPFFFFFNDTATTEIYTLSLHDALPILPSGPRSSTWSRPRRRRSTSA